MSFPVLCKLSASKQRKMPNVEFVFINCSGGVIEQQTDFCQKSWGGYFGNVIGYRLQVNLFEM